MTEMLPSLEELCMTAEEVTVGDVTAGAVTAEAEWTVQSVINQVEDIKRCMATWPLCAIDKKHYGHFIEVTAFS